MTAPTLENDMYGCFLAHAWGENHRVWYTHHTYPGGNDASESEPGLCPGW